MLALNPTPGNVPNRIALALVCHELVVYMSGVGACRLHYASQIASSTKVSTARRASLYSRFT
jgi:hypothetical protein